MKFETITEIANNGKTKIWNIQVEEHEGYGKIITSYGYKDGKQQTNEKLITKGKNIGKKNETTPYQQALSEAQSLWNKKNEKSKLILPMLAQDYKKHKSHIVFPCFIQPKLDGVRMIATRISNHIIFRSRMGKELMGLEHIEKELIDNHIIDFGESLDGELYSKNMSFDELSGYCRTIKDNNKYTNLPEFWVFDTCDTTRTFALRQPIFGAYHRMKYIHQVSCSECSSEKQVWSSLKEFEKDGWEGIILRNKNGMYKNNYRSYDLQKLKSFQDQEFPIIDVLEATGIDQGTAIFVCSFNQNQFHVKPQGSRELRKSYLQNKEDYIGKLLTVRFQEMTKTGVPRFPVGVIIRDYE